MTSTWDNFIEKMKKITIDKPIILLYLLMGTIGFMALGSFVTVITGDNDAIGCIAGIFGFVIMVIIWKNYKQSKETENNKKTENKLGV